MSAGIKLLGRLSILSQCTGVHLIALPIRICFMADTLLAVPTPLEETGENND